MNPTPLTSPPVTSGPLASGPHASGPFSASPPAEQHPGRPIVLAAGGTGGHLFPAEALARELVGRGVSVVLVTDRRGGAFGDRLPEVPVLRVRASAPAGGLMSKLKAVALLAAGTLEARALLGRLRPAAVVGFGGYPSLPAGLAARLAGLPLILHEQNAVLGRANRLLVGGAVRLAATFPELAAVRAGDRGRIVVTGNPVRRAFAAVADTPYQAPCAEGPLRLVVLGGSQGARVFSDLVPAALALLPAGMRARLHLTQQCRREDRAAAEAALAGLGLGAFALSHFFTDVPERLAAAHLVLCRAGASTIAELTVTGRPALLVPYPYATDDHQSANAAAVAAAGAGWRLDQAGLDAASLAGHLAGRLADPAGLAAAAAAALRLGRVDAARQLAELVLGAALPGACTGTGSKACCGTCSGAGQSTSSKPVTEAA